MLIAILLWILISFTDAKREPDPRCVDEVNKVTRDLVADSRIRRLKKTLERRPIANNRTLEVEFTKIELDPALRKGKASNSPGLDGVAKEMQGHLGPSAKLLHLFNRA
ncbi:hypothetical protein PoB_001270500 [Plakobranchus ocellatus]|uniref:Uncharacterized protein n=1 Tax=Plakobranchus ocellatus TaxID=259542 RepID=A0AAV3YUU2_9GAST|nr:hypothetical protein PoB_001270500 [Plakobranchus ocellatus]